MNINPSAAASVAGTSHAAARGGETDKQATDAARQQSAAESPTGKAADSSAVDAGDQTGDRGGNGRQVLDVFERSDAPEDNSEETLPQRKSASADGTGEHLDLEA